MADVDVPVVAAAVDVDVADDRFGGAGRVVAADVEQAQDRLGAVPVLAEGGLGPLDGLAGQFPVGVQPVGIADHDDDAVLAVAGGQVLGHLGGQVLGGHADVVLAASRPVPRRRRCRRCCGRRRSEAAIWRLCRRVLSWRLGRPSSSRRASIRSSLRMSCQPAMPFFRAMSARTFLVAARIWIVFIQQAPSAPAQGGGTG